MSNDTFSSLGVAFTSDSGVPRQSLQRELFCAPAKTLLKSKILFHQLSYPSRNRYQQTELRRQKDSAAHLSHQLVLQVLPHVSARLIVGATAASLIFLNAITMATILCHRRRDTNKGKG